MALPGVATAGAVGTVVGRKALETAAAPLANLKDQLLSPLKQTFGPLNQFVKEVQGQIGNKEDVDNAIRITADEQEKTTSGIELLSEAIDRLSDTLEDYFAKQQEADEASRAQKLTAQQTAEAVFTSDAVPAGDQQDSTSDSKFSPIVKFFKGIMEFSKILKAAAIGVAIPALISFFQSDAFVKIKEFVVDKWPSIKESFVNSFQIILDFFGGVGDIISEVFSGETSFAEKLKAVFIDLPMLILKSIGGIVEQAVNLIGELFDAGKLGTRIKDFITGLIPSSARKLFGLDDTPTQISDDKVTTTSSPSPKPSARVAATAPTPQPTPQIEPQPDVAAVKQTTPEPPAVKEPPKLPEGIYFSTMNGKYGAYHRQLIGDEVKNYSSEHATIEEAVAYQAEKEKEVEEFLKAYQEQQAKVLDEHIAKIKKRPPLSKDQRIEKLKKDYAELQQVEAAAAEGDTSVRQEDIEFGRQKIMQEAEQLGVNLQPATPAGAPAITGKTSTVVQQSGQSEQQQAPPVIIKGGETIVNDQKSTNFQTNTPPMAPAFN